MMMKKTISYFIVILFILVMQGCHEDVLDVKNLQVYNPEDVWNDETLANAYLSDLYATTLNGWPVNSGDNADESGGILGEGAVQTTNSTFKYWPYSTIRQMNILFRDIDDGSLSEEVRNNIKGQARFLRAYHYFNAVVHHGGVPIIDEVQELDEDLMVSRNSTAECFEFIINDLDQAISMLPDHNTGDNYGRVDKGAAHAFKGRVLLYMASPQFNPDNPYGNNNWQDAYQANKTAKEFLEGTGHGLVEDYGDIFMTEDHKEAILPIIYEAPDRTNGRQEHGVRPLSESKNATGYDQPIWSLVKSYPMKDGKQPGNSSNYSYDVQTFWQNRDPRFYETIVYNGDVYELGGEQGRRQYTDLEVGDINDGFGDQQGFYRTGFYCRKGIEVSLPQAEVGENDVDWLEIRFAEVLMNYAEAANETGHPGEAVAILKQIRERAGIEAGSNNMYGLDEGMTRSQIREALYHERYIEFAFEGKRFWDLRRARRLHTDINGMHKYGLEAQLKEGLDPNADTTYLPSDFNYTVRELITQGQEEMYTPEEYYFFPIHKDEIEKNPNLEQTQGWEGGQFDPTL